MIAKYYSFRINIAGKLVYKSMTNNKECKDDNLNRIILSEREILEKKSTDFIYDQTGDKANFIYYFNNKIYTTGRGFINAHKKYYNLININNEK